MRTPKKLDECERTNLFKQYTKLQEIKYEIEHTIRNTSGWPAAKAYWFGSLSSAINDSEYVNSNPTFKSYLISEGIMDEEENFIEEEEEEEEDSELGPLSHWREEE